jgi:hypothetical protein
VADKVETLKLNGRGTEAPEVDIQCGPADVEALNSLWDRQTPNWRAVISSVAKEINNHAVCPFSSQLVLT